MEMKIEIAEQVYFGSMPLEEMKQLQAKANNYDSLVEKIREYCKTNIEQLNSGEILSIRAILKDILELLDTEKEEV